MKLFAHKENIKDIFYCTPENINRNAGKDLIAMALGGTMYVPGNKKGIADKLINHSFKNLTSFILCLEDSIADNEVDEAEKNVVDTLRKIKEKVYDGQIDINELPWIFLRVRNEEQLIRILKNNNSIEFLNGIVVPKVDSCTLENYIHQIRNFNLRNNRNMYILPILETAKVMHIETRMDELNLLKEIIVKNRDIIISIRTGVTDLLSVYSLRRNKVGTIYDNIMFIDFLKDVFNIFMRREHDFIISGPVWERFQTKIDENFIKEIQMDKLNGMIGKTVIHPSQIPIVNAVYAVTREEYEDAVKILENSNDGVNGVLNSVYSNKMNEVKPHYNWAIKVVKRARVYGVLNEGVEFIDLI